MSEHGNEGTHICCDTRLKTEGEKARCCVCVPHDGCTLREPAEPVVSDELVKKIYQILSDFEQPTQLGTKSNYADKTYTVAAFLSLITAEREAYADKRAIEELMNFIEKDKWLTGEKAELTKRINNRISQLKKGLK